MSTTEETTKKVTPKKTTGKKAVTKKEGAKKEGDKLNKRQLIRDAAAGKVTKEKFTETLVAHYKAKGRDDAWIGKRIKRLWRRTGK